MLKQLVVSLFVIFSLSALAQEGIKPLGANINYLYRELQPAVSVKPESPESQKHKPPHCFSLLLKIFITHQALITPIKTNG